MSESYKIDLGIFLNQGDLGKIKTQLNNFQNQKKIELEINRKKIDNQLNSIRKQIQNLSNIKIDLGGNGGNNSLSLNIEGLDTSLKEVATSIKAIKKTLGTLDDGGEMKSLLSSVNQISTALDKASSQFAELNAQLDALSKKSFNPNIIFDVGKKNNNMIGYGRAARKQVIPELEAQIKYLEDLFGGQQAAMTKLTRQGKKVGFDVFADFNDFNSDSAIKKMEAMEKYINSLKKLATIDNVNLDGFNEIHKDASTLINDITGIENAVDKASDVPEKLKNLFGSSVDGEGLSKQLDSIVTDLGEIKTAIQGLSQNNAIDGLTQSFNKLSETLNKLIDDATGVQNILSSVGNGANTGISNQARNAQETAQAFKEVAQEAKKISNINIDISDGNIDEIKNALRNLNVDDSDIEEATKELNELNMVAQNVSATFKDGQIAKVDIKGVETTVDGLKRAVTATTTFGDEGAKTSIKFAQSFDKIAAEVQQIQDKLNDTGAKGFAQEMQVAKDRAQQFKDSSEDLAECLKRLDTAMEAVKNASVYDADDISGAQRLVEANQQYETALKNVNSQLKSLEYAQKQSINLKALEAAKDDSLSRLDGLFERGSQAAKKYATRVEELRNEINKCGNTKDIGIVNKRIAALGREIDNAKVKTQTFAQSLRDQWEQYKSYLSVASLISYGTQALRSMFEQVKLIDSAMTELKKVTDETAESYEKFLTNAASRAKEIGTTIDGLVSSTADFARLGYGFEDAQGLAEVANIYAVVGDEIEGVEDATESLISTMAAFKGEMNGMSNTDFAMSIVDKFNEIGNNFAISSGGIGEALERSASSLMAANNTIDESIALITAANTVVVLCHAA